jgi:hypothetical protein
LKIAELEIGDNNKKTLKTYCQPTTLPVAYHNLLSKFKSGEFINKYRQCLDRPYSLGKITWLKKIKELLGERVKSVPIFGPYKKRS